MVDFFATQEEKRREKHAKSAVLNHTWKNISKHWLSSN